MLNSTKNDDKNLIQTILSMKNGNAFKKYIDFIQFPYFRNLTKNTRITFDFPLTVFVGQNGSGKSSTLHALYGAPLKKTPYDFWFSTEVDPIEETSSAGDRHCFFYSYKSNGIDREVLKTRIFKRNNPDYWETSRPLDKYGMKKIPRRNRPIDKSVNYLDFRSELSAFDKYFYFSELTRGLKSKTKQEYLRRKSVQLKNLIDQSKTYIKAGPLVQNERLHMLSSDELTWISKILGRDYVEGKYLRHKLFANWGVSIYLRTHFFKYSEAFAGSGELAVVRLVHEMLKCNDNSLILLDEPEVSLHPGAQERLRNFLLTLVKQKKLQVIISSHSPAFIEGLPANAIKVFSQLPDGKFAIENKITPHEAFYYLEQTFAERKNVITEDILAKAVIEAVLDSLGKATAGLFDIRYFPGGASVLINRNIPVYSQNPNFENFIFFDGDQKKVETHFDPDAIIQSQQTNEKYQAEIKKQTGSDVKFFPDGGIGGGDKEQEKHLQWLYLQFYLSKVFYLPRKTPEEIIWDDETAEKLLDTFGIKDKFNSVKNEPAAKKRFAEIQTLTAMSISEVHNPFLTKWKKIKNDDYQYVKAVIEQIKNS